MIEYKVRNGDTLSAISKQYYRNSKVYKLLANHNDIKNPDHIEAGKIIKIPKWLAERKEVGRKSNKSIIKVTTYKCLVTDDDLCKLKFEQDKSNWPAVCDPFLENSTTNIKAIFSSDKDTECSMIAEIINESDTIIKSINAQEEEKNIYRVSWDGTDKKNKKVSIGKYTVRISATKNDCIVSDAESSTLKIVRVGVTEMQFLNTIPLKIFCNYKSGLRWKKHDFDIPDIQWKIKSLNDSKGDKLAKEPDVSIDKPSSDKDNHSYPVCYIKESKLSCKVTIAGENFDAGDKIRVIIRDTAQFDGKNNENITPGSQPTCTATDTNKLPGNIDMLENYCMDLHFYYKSQDGSWKEMGVQRSTKHTIFTIIDNPVEPWGDGSSPKKVRPWIHVIKMLCSDWVKGENDEDTISGKIVEKVFHSGVKYDTTQGKSAYTSGADQEYAEFRKWINYTAGINNHNGSKVNCTDCGTMVTCCANILGCELHSSKFFKPKIQAGVVVGFEGFSCHKIISIGYSTWDYPFSQHHGGTSGGFSYHEIAWEGNCDKTDDVYDACLKVAQDPVSQPATNDIYVKNMSYDIYEPKLVVAADVPDVYPFKQMKIRRMVR